MIRRTAIAIFYDENKNIVVQERASHSKMGEKYGFWGGGIEENETPEAAIKRELNEELGFVPEELIYWTKHIFVIEEEGKYKGWIIELDIFLSHITPRLLSARSREGGNIIKLGIDTAISDNGFHSSDVQLLKKLKDYLSW
jgi:mutator protein MutT